MSCSLKESNNLAEFYAKSFGSLKNLRVEVGQRYDVSLY